MFLNILFSPICKAQKKMNNVNAMNECNNPLASLKKEISLGLLLQQEGKKLRFGTWPRNRLLQKEEDSAGLDELLVVRQKKLFPSDLFLPQKKKKKQKNHFWVGINFWQRAGVSSSLSLSLWKNKARSRGGVLLVLDFAACKLRYRRERASEHTPSPFRSTLCSSHRSVVFIQCGSASNKSSGI
jgi:hypothetical protein